MSKRDKNISVVWEPSNEDAVIRLYRTRFGRVSPLPLSEWSAVTVGAKILGIANHGHTDSNGVAAAIIDQESNAVRLTHAWAAALDESVAQNFMLYPSTPLTLKLSSHLQPTHPDFRIDLTFTDRASRPVRTERVGAFLKRGAAWHRLPDPLYSIAQSAEKLSSPERNLDKKMQILSELTELLNDTYAHNFEADRFLDNLYFSYAGALSLSLDTKGNEFDFSPVLFGRNMSSDEGDDDNPIDESKDSLLTKVKTQKFLDSYNQSQLVHPGMKVGPSHFVYFPESVRKCLEVVKFVKQQNPEVRKRFALNPRPFFREKFEAADSEEYDIDQIFIETDQYSRRVTGADVWRKPVTPWLKSTPNSWLPEKCGIRIQDSDADIDIDLSFDQAQDLHDKIKDAIEQKIDAVH